MSRWISVYCQKSIRMSASMLEKAIKRGCTDYRDNDYFDDLFEVVKVKSFPAKGKALPSLFHLTYKTKSDPKFDSGKVPIVLDRISDSDEVEGMVKEQLEDYLKSRKGPKAALVRAHLANVVEIYSFCLKQSHCKGAGPIVVAIAREFLAKKGKGMVREDGVGWLKMTPFGLFEALKD